MPSTTGPSTRNAATTLDRYFTLSDTAGHSQTDFEELIGLFAPDGRIARLRVAMEGRRP